MYEYGHLDSKNMFRMQIYLPVSVYKCGIIENIL